MKINIKCPNCGEDIIIEYLDEVIAFLNCQKCKKQLKIKVAEIEGLNRKNVTIVRDLKSERKVEFNDNWVSDASKISLMPFQNLEEIKLADQLHSIDNIYARIKTKFKEVYGFDASNIELISNKTSRAIKAYYDYEAGKIYIDVALIDTLHTFFITILTWIDNYEEKNTFSSFFNYITTIFYALLKHNTICNVYNLKYIKREFQKHSPALNIAVNCQYFAIYFCLAHEVAHAYIKSLNKEYKSRDEEYEADKIAYDIVLRLMIDEEKSLVHIEDRELFNYCYLVPMMFFDLMDLYYRLQLFITGEKVSVVDSPSVIKRKNALFSIPSKDIYEFDTVKGNIIYNDFLNVIDYYKSMLKYKEHDGSLIELFKLIEKPKEE